MTDKNNKAPKSDVTVDLPLMGFRPSRIWLILAGSFPVLTVYMILSYPIDFFTEPGGFNLVPGNWVFLSLFGLAWELKGVPERYLQPQLEP